MSNIYRTKIHIVVLYTLPFISFWREGERERGVGKVKPTISVWISTTNVEEIEKVQEQIALINKF